MLTLIKVKSYKKLIENNNRLIRSSYIFYELYCVISKFSDLSVNVISVEWSRLAAGPNYPRAAANTQLVSAKSYHDSFLPK